MDCKEEKLKELMALDFKLYDMQLYLNTHPYDAYMIESYQELAEEAEAARKKYEAEYGPLKAISGAKDCEWKWINNPWPWERGV